IRFENCGDLCSYECAHIVLFCGEMKPRRTVKAVSVEQSHGRHIEMMGGVYELFWNRRALEKAECRPRMQFDVFGICHKLRISNFKFQIRIPLRASSAAYSS